MHSDNSSTHPPPQNSHTIIRKYVMGMYYTFIDWNQGCDRQVKLLEQ